MKNSKKMVKQETMLILAVIALVIGFILGVFFAVYKLDSTPSLPKKTTETVQEHGNFSQEQIQALHSLKAALKANPKNAQAWIQLGHLYFDGNEPENAINAYLESLKLHKGSANLWTDLGVMYRRVKQFDKALEMFDKAIAMDKTHEPSRLNKGIVLMYDLGKNDEAIKTWEELSAINPNSQVANGGTITEFLEHIKNNLQAQETQK